MRINKMNEIQKNNGIQKEENICLPGIGVEENNTMWHKLKIFRLLFGAEMGAGYRRLSTSSLAQSPNH